MKRVLLFTAYLLFCLSNYAATIRTAASGNFTSSSTWIGGVVPISTDKIIISDNHVLTVNAGSTVDEVRYEYSSSASGFVVNNGVTFTVSHDFIIDVPNGSNATANITINGTMNVGSTTGDDFRIFLENNEDHLTVNLTVTGTLNIAGILTHASGTNSTSNNININVSGNFSCGNMTFDFAAQSSTLDLTISGVFTCGNIYATANKTNSLLKATLTSGADVDAGLWDFETYQTNSNLSFDAQSGSDYRGTSSFFLMAHGSDSDIDVSLNGLMRSTYFAFLSYELDDSVQVNIGSNGDIRASTLFRVVNLGTSSSYNSLIVANGGYLKSNTYLETNTSDNGELLFNNDGQIVIGRYYGNYGSSSNIDINFSGNSIVTTTNDFQIYGDGSSTIDFTNHGILNCGLDFEVTGKASDIINLDLINTISAGGTYRQSTVGTGSSIKTQVKDSLICETVRFDITSPATSANNELNIYHNNAVLQTEFILMNTTLDGTLTSGSDSNSTVIYNGNFGSFYIASGSTVEYDNLIIENTNSGGIALTGTLDENNFFGDLQISSTARFNCSSTANLDVQGSMFNFGTFDSPESRMHIKGVASSSNLWNHHGASLQIDGDFTLSGTFDNHIASSGDTMLIGFDFFNNGTFEADFEHIIIGRDLQNNGLYSSTGSNNLRVRRHFDNNATFTAQAGDSIIFDGTSAQNIDGTHTVYNMTVDNSNGVTINSGMTSLQEVLDINSGQLSTGGLLTLLSNSAGTAALADLTGGGTISGNVTVQRYINESAGWWWYMLGSPTTNATLAQWDNDIPMYMITGATPGGGTSPSVYYYDVDSVPNGGDYSLGYVRAKNVTDALNSSQGYMVWHAGGTATIDATGPLTTGTINTGTLGYNTKPSGNDATRGWHLRSNPYASPLDWSLVTKSNLGNSGEAYVSGSGGSYLSVNADNVDYIYSGEAFWVKVNTGGGSLTFDESDKAIVSDDFNARSYNSNSTFTNPLKMELTYSTDPSYMDYAVMRFGGDSNSVNFDNVWGEAYKVPNSLGTPPNIATVSLADSINVYYNNISPNDSNFTIPVNVWKTYPLNKTESYTIDFNGIENWVKDNHCLILTDSLNNYSIKLDQNNHDYSWSEYDTATSAHIYLTHSVPLDVSNTDATCFGYNDASAVVNGYGSGTHTYIWQDKSGNILKKENDISGPSSMNNLSAGEYIVWVKDNGVCGEIGATIIVNEPEPIIAEFSSDVDSVWMNVNSTIYFTNNSINADDYEWDFGDGNSSNSESPAHTYTKGGIYKVQLVGITGPCSDTLMKTVVVIDNVAVNEIDNRSEEEVNIYQQYNETFVQLNFSEKTNATIVMFDMLGREIMEPLALNNVRKKKVRLNVPDNTSGVHTITVLYNDNKESKKLYYSK